MLLRGFLRPDLNKENCHTDPSRAAEGGGRGEGPRKASEEVRLGPPLTRLNRDQRDDHPCAGLLGLRTNAPPAGG